MSDPTLRILQVSTVDIGGGAEKIARDLFTSYRTLRHRSWLAVGTKRLNDADEFLIPTYPNRFSRSISSLFNRFPHAEHISRKIETLTAPARIYNYLTGHENFDYPGTWNLLNLTPEPPDILHCHNLHGGYFDLRALPFLSHQVPTVLTLHDAWLLAGHCAHSFDCERWKVGCGRCPDLSIYPTIKHDATAYNWKRKAEIFKRSQLHVVTPSKWLMDKVEESMLKPGVLASKVIPNGVDLKVFHPADRVKARESLGLPHNANILLFAANGILENIWKDYKTLRSALAEIAKSSDNVLCIALGEAAPPERIGNIEIRFIPYQKDQEQVAQYYQAADLYLQPSRVDTFPTTVLEALASGIPVVATAVGGIPEQIVEGKTGFLVPPGDAGAMAGWVLNLLGNEGFRLQMGREAAEDAARRFSLERMVRDYLAFYREILEEQEIASTI